MELSDLDILKRCIEQGDDGAVQGMWDKYVSKVPKHADVDYSNIGCDPLADALKPQDIPYSNLRSIKTNGDGNCLFNSVSAYLKGDESLSKILRILSACELYLHADFYGNHPNLDQATEHPGITTTDRTILFSLWLTNSTVDKSNDSFSRCVKEEAGMMCSDRKWCSMLQVLSLPNIINEPVFSVYPEVTFNYRPLFNAHVTMRQPLSQIENVNNVPLVIMWTRDGNLDSRTGTVFVPNHFCALVDDREFHKLSKKRKRSKTHEHEPNKERKASNLKQPSVLAFFTKPVNLNSGDNITVNAPCPKTHANDTNQIHEVNTNEGQKTSTNKLENSDSKCSAKAESSFQNSYSANNMLPGNSSICNAEPLKAPLKCANTCCETDIPFQPVDDTVLKGSVRFYKNRKRCFLPKWFQDFPWLTFCRTSNRVFCSVCRKGYKLSLLTFSNKSELSFITDGFNNWKKCPAAFQSHECSSTHNEITEKNDFIAKDTNVQVDITKQNTDEKFLRRECLVQQLRALRFLARQGLAIRGKNQGEGNFEMLQELLRDMCESYQKWCNLNEYQSPTIVNEQIKLMGNSLLREKLKHIYNAKWFSIIADEARDIANREQLSISIRWVGKNFEVYEDCIGLVELANTTANTIYLSIKDVLLRLSLPLENCRGQAYDGASNFMGRINGVAQKIQNEFSKAIIVHCFAHCLNLSLQDSCRDLKCMRSAIDLVKEIASLIKFSPKRQVLFENIKFESGNSTGSVKPLCPTRWTVRTSAIGAVLQNYNEVIQTMDEVNETGNDEYSRRAGGVSSLMQKFSSYFGLKLSFMLFSVTEQLSTSLQYKDCCVSDADSGLKAVVSFCDRHRTEDAFNLFYNQVESESASLTERPEVPRYKRVPKKLDEGTDSVRFICPRDYFKQQYYEAVDTVKGQVTKRLQSNNVTLLQTIERLLINGANGEFQCIPESIKSNYQSDIDMVKLEAQLQLLPDMIRSSSDVKCVTNVRTICDILQNAPGGMVFMSCIAQLLQIYFTVPVTTATAERSFSALRRLKTYLRSSMTQQRLNNLMLLHCHKDDTDNLDLTDVAKMFISCNTNRMAHFGSFD